MDFDVFWCKMKLRVCLFPFRCFQHTFVESRITKTLSEIKSDGFSLSRFQRCRQTSTNISSEGRLDGRDIVFAWCSAILKSSQPTRSPRNFWQNRKTLKNKNVWAWAPRSAKLASWLFWDPEELTSAPLPRPGPAVSLRQSLAYRAFLNSFFLGLRLK